MNNFQKIQKKNSENQHEQQKLKKFDDDERYQVIIKEVQYQEKERVKLEKIDLMKDYIKVQRSDGFVIVTKQTIQEKKDYQEFMKNHVMKTEQKYADEQQKQFRVQLKENQINTIVNYFQEKQDVRDQKFLNEIEHTEQMKNWSNQEELFILGIRLLVRMGLKWERTQTYSFEIIIKINF